MKRWRVTAALAVASLVLPFSVLAAEEPVFSTVLITELQTTGINEQDDPVLTNEFIELYNASDQTIDLTGWNLQTAAASSSNWQNVSLTPALNDVLEPGEHLLISSNSYLAEADHTYAAKLSQTGGHVRLVSPDNSTPYIGDVMIHDLLGWGTAAHAEGGHSAPSVEEGHSLKRRLDENANYVDTNDNLNDFVDSDSPFPEFSQSDLPAEEPAVLEEEEPVEEPEEEPEEVLEEEQPEEPEAEVESSTTEEQELLNPLITELLPNPASPATDAEDEYVELFNPNAEPFLLENFKLQTGATFGYTVTFDDQIIPAQGYLLVYSKDTNLTLSNSSGDARLLNAAGEVVAEVDGYNDAEEGLAWAQIAGTWQWTATPTPSLPNLLATPVATTLKSKTTKSAAKKSSTKKAAKPKASKASKTIAETERAIYEDPLEDGVITPVHPSILAGVGIAAVVYSLYEYRYDLQNRLERFRRYRTTRRAARG